MPDADTTATGSQGTSKDESLPWITVQNETRAKLIVPGSDRELVLAPLECRRLRLDACEPYTESLKRLEDLRCISAWPDRPERQNKVLAFVGLGFWLVVFWLLGGIFFSSPTYWFAGLAGVIVIAVVAFVTARHDPSVFALMFSLVLVLSIGVLGPATAVYFGGDVHEPVDQVVAGTHDELAFLTLIGRGLQWVFISVAAVLPALLFFLFDRVKLATLRQRFEREMLRFDPSVKTLSDVRAKYGSGMDEVFGPVPHHAGPVTSGLPDGHKPAPHGARRLLPDRRGPVVMATVVITIGWILALLNPDVEAPLESFQEIVLLFEPQRSPVIFAFLGAYVFSLNAVLRSYVRSDLRPKSYTHIAIRIIIAVVFAWVLEALFFSTPQATTTQDALLVLAFVVGMLPDTLLVRLQETARSFAKALNSSVTLVERYPLTDLEGIDIYDRARLLDEGVGNIEGLAHHDLPSLMMYTRIPAGRLVHWTDQAILALHVAATNEEGDLGHTRLATLKAHGIHTATDLMHARDKAVQRAEENGDTPERAEPNGGAPAEGTQGNGDDELRAFFFLLGEGSLSRIQMIIDAIEDEQWMRNLAYWHEDHDTPQTLKLVDSVVEVIPDPLHAPDLDEVAGGAERTDGRRSHARATGSRSALRFSAERPGPGGPAGLQNR